MGVKCDYCGNDAELVTGNVIYPHRRDHLVLRKFWLCRPCDAYVGTHENSNAVPLGRLANAELRALKQQVHKAFDPLWLRREMSRTEAYRWLAQALDIPEGECHVGMFDTARCRAALAALATRG